MGVKKKSLKLVCICLSLLLFSNAFVAIPNVKAETTNSTDISTAEDSLGTVIEDISNYVDVEEDGITISDKSIIVKDISQEDIDNLNELAKSQGIEYDKPLTKESLISMFEEGIDKVNEEITNDNLEVLDDGTLIDANDSDFYVQGGSTYDKTYWWGKKRYKSTSAANKWVSQLNTAANANGAGALLAGAIFGAVGAIPNGLTSFYCYQLANKVSYRNSLNNRGIIADVTWALVFTTKSQ